MKFENAFEVPLPPAAAWPLLMDVERIAPCMPGAELTRVGEDGAFEGKVSVRIGPVALTFEGTARFESIDAANRTARVLAQGRDPKGRGGASAVVDFRLAESAAGAQVTVETDLTLSGSVAQYGRGAGMIKSVAQQLVNQFAGNLADRIAVGGDDAAPPSAPSPAAAVEPGTGAAVGAPVSGLTLLWRAFRDWLAGLFGTRS